MKMTRLVIKFLLIVFCYLFCTAQGASPAGGGSPNATGLLYTLNKLPYSSRCDPLDEAIHGRDEDKDCDGLKDESETLLANAFRPFLIFDENESCADGLRILFQLTPVTKTKLDLKLVYLYPKDCGNLSHKGDSQQMEMFIKSDDQGRSWYLETNTIGFNSVNSTKTPTAHTRYKVNGRYYCKVFNPKETHLFTERETDGMKHLKVFISEDKHWAFPTKGHCEASYHAAKCENCGSRNKGILIEYGAAYRFSTNQFTEKRRGNIGEPPYAYLIYDLDIFGFPGEDTFTGRCFCGGYRSKLKANQANNCKAINKNVIPYYCADPVNKKWNTSSISLLQGSRKSVRTLFNYGGQWGKSDYVTDIAFANIDADTAEEVVVGRKTSSGSRLFIFDDANNKFRLLYESSFGWGSSAYVTALAAADLNNDRKDEVIIGRTNTSGDKLFIYRVKTVRFMDSRTRTVHSKVDLERLKSFRYGGSVRVTALATGDVDGDSRDEIVVGRDTGNKYQNERYIIYDDALANFKRLNDGDHDGHNWGKSAKVTAIATGDIDKDGKDEIVLGRNTNSGGGNFIENIVYDAYKKSMKYLVLDDASRRFQPINNTTTDGSSWGASNFVTSVTVGDLDNDGHAEIGIARQAQDITYPSLKYFILKYAPGRNGNFRYLYRGGGNWGKNANTTAIAFGNIDRDGKLEIGLARHGSSNMRYMFMDDTYHFAKTYVEFGGSWPAGRYIRKIRFGDVDGDGIQEAAIGIRDDKNKTNKFQIIKFLTEASTIRSVSVKPLVHSARSTGSQRR